MRRIALLILAAFLIAGAAGCSTVQPVAVSMGLSEVPNPFDPQKPAGVYETYYDIFPDVPLPRVEELVERYAAFYADAPFVQVLSAGVLPRTASVAGTNHAHVGVGIVEAARAIVAVGAIDNLGKGAAGQAVQCANVVFGLPPTRGLQAVAVPV